MFKRGAVVLLALAGVVLSTGCVFRGPSGIKDQVERSSGKTYNREFGITVGRTSLGIARMAMRFGDEDEAVHLLKGVNKVQVGIYEVVDDGDGRPARASDFGLYDPLVQVREDGETVLVLARADEETIRRLLVVVDSDDELVIVRLRGDLEAIIEDAIRLGLSEGGRDELADPVLEEYRRRDDGSRSVFL
jgi:hypothetical protein